MGPLAKIVRYAVFPILVVAALWFTYVFLAYGFWVHWLWIVAAALLALVAVGGYTAYRGSSARRG